MSEKKLRCDCYAENVAGVWRITGQAISVTTAERFDGSEPSVELGDGGVRVSWEDGRWEFYPWAAISEVSFTPAEEPST